MLAGCFVFSKGLPFRDPPRNVRLSPLGVRLTRSALRAAIAIPSLRSLRIASPLPTNSLCTRRLFCFFTKAILFRDPPRNARLPPLGLRLTRSALRAAIAIPSLRSLRIASPLPTNSLCTRRLFCFFTKAILFRDPPRNARLPPLGLRSLPERTRRRSVACGRLQKAAVNAWVYCSAITPKSQSSVGYATIFSAKKALPQPTIS